MNAKTVVIVAVVAVAFTAIAAVLVSRSRESTAAQEYGQKMFPELGTRANEVNGIVVNHGGVVMTVEKKGTAWVLAEKGGYPVKLGKVKEVVMGLAALKQLEPKTSKPERYAEIGVEDPPAQPVAAPAIDPADPNQMPPEKSQAALVTLNDAGGKGIVSAIVGKQRLTNQPAIFVRKAGEAQSWLAEGQIDLPREMNQWLDTQIINLGRDRVKSASVKSGASGGGAEGSALVVSKQKKEDASFTVEGVPEGRTLKTPTGGDSLAQGLGYLNFDDVAQGSTVAAPEGAVPTVFEARTFDGMVVTGKVFEKDGKYWGSFAASVDEGMLPKAPPIPEVPPADPAKPVDPAQPDPAKAAADEAKRLADEAIAQAEAVKKEVKDFNDRHGGWVYAIPEYKAKVLMMRMEELLAEKAAEEGPKEPPLGEGAPQLDVPPVPIPERLPEEPKPETGPESEPAPVEPK